MKNKMNPKVIIAVIIVLIALGIFAVTMTNADNASIGHSHGEHGHEH